MQTTLTKPPLKSPKPKQPRRTVRPLDSAEYAADGIDVFCKRVGISKSLYHKLRSENRGPDVVKLGRRVVITREAASRWLLSREGRPAA